MDEVTRGYVESTLDAFLKSDIIPNVEWIREETTIKSLPDLALGYIVGGAQLGTLAMLSVSHFIEGHSGVTEQDKIEIRAIIKRRLPEFVQKITREINK